jgi:hypothetical protein
MDATVTLILAMAVNIEPIDLAVPVPPYRRITWEVLGCPQAELTGVPLAAKCSVPWSAVRKLTLQSVDIDSIAIRRLIQSHELKQLTPLSLDNLPSKQHLWRD